MYKRNYEIIGGYHKKQPNKTIDQIVKEVAVACKLVSDGANIEEYTIYKETIIQCLQDVIVSNADSVKNQEVILHNTFNTSNYGNNFHLNFSKNKWYEEEKYYQEHNCYSPYSFYSYDFDIKALTSVIFRYGDYHHWKKASQISESGLMNQGYRGNYYCLEMNSGYQTMIIPSRNIFPIKLRGIFSFIDPQMTLDENGHPKTVYYINQTSDSNYLESLAPEELNNITIIAIPIILMKLGKAEAVTQTLYQMSQDAQKKINKISKMPFYPFLD